MLNIPSQHSLMDRLGASLSVACALHCALQPVLFLALPFLGLGFLLNEQAETLFLLFSACLASFSLWQGHRHHGQGAAFPVLALSLVFLVASRWPGLEQMEMLLAVTGALGIASAHGINMYLHRQFHQHQPAQSHPHTSHDHEVKTETRLTSDVYVQEAVTI